MFAKLFQRTKHGQILALLDANENEEPVIRFYCQPQGFGVCSAETLPFMDTVEGWGMAESFFKSLDQAAAIETVEYTILDKLKDMEVLEIIHDQPQQPTLH